ncbi:MAG: phage minor head protein [Eubacteriales bacterium]
MAFVFRPPKRKNKRKILKAKERELYQRLKDFISNEEPQLVRLLEVMWAEQGKALTYEELQQAYFQGDFTGAQWQKWIEVYSQLILEDMLPIWESAAVIGATNVALDYSIPFLSPSDYSGDYYRQYGAELITNMVEQQREAIQSTLWQLFQNQDMNSTEASYFLRPLIGLTAPQMASNYKYYNNILEGLKKDFPSLSSTKAEEQARKAAEKYAARQHRYRAQMIARTELATFYNAGQDLAIEQAIAEGLLPPMDSIWSTAITESTCDMCRRMDGERVPKGKVFSNGMKFPPAHPHCGCAVMYEPSEEWLYEDGNIPNHGLTNGGIGGNMESGDRMRETKPSYTIDADNKVRVDVTPENYTYDLLPKLDKICVPVGKLTGYSLNMNHKGGKNKAFRLKEKLGYDLTNYEHLLDNIISNVNKHQALEKGDLGYGMRYEVIIPMTGPNGQNANVLTGWIDSDETGEMSLTNVYIK